MKLLSTKYIATLLTAAAASSLQTFATVTDSDIAAEAAAETAVEASSTADAYVKKKDLSFWLPEIHGTVRPRFEVDTRSGNSRFQMRNARLSVGGKISRSIDYYFQVDACNQGKFSVLDFWVRIKPVKGLSVQAGQFRMPYGIDPFRSPHTYYFANRSFIGKQICNVRAVGLKLSYDFDKAPLSIEAGIFNPTPISSHQVWNSTFAYAGRAIYSPGNMKFATGFQSIRPDGIRTNLIDACIGWSDSRWIVEGEYMYKHYTHNSHKPCHGYLLFADYRLPIKLGVFNRLSFQSRFDGMTAHSSAERDTDGKLTTDDPARNRITVGSTISYIRTKSMYVDLRANYEKYFYHKDIAVADGMSDKFILELVVRF